MKYIFPKNYNYKNKILGVMDYPTAIFNVIVFVLIFAFFNLIFNNISLKVIMIVAFYFPVFLFSFIGFNNESILYTLFYIVKFLLSPKLYLYQ